MDAFGFIFVRTISYDEAQNDGKLRNRKKYRNSAPIDYKSTLQFWKKNLSKDLYENIMGTNGINCMFHFDMFFNVRIFCVDYSMLFNNDKWIMVLLVFSCF